MGGDGEVEFGFEVGLEIGDIGEILSEIGDLFLEEFDHFLLGGNDFLVI